VLPRGSWVRERLNRWHDERVDAAFTFAQWGACRQSSPLDNVVGRYTIGVDVEASWQEGTIVVSAMRQDERVGVEVHRHLKARPTQALTADDFVREVLKLSEKIEVERIVYAHSSALLPAMERIGIEKGLPCESVTSTRLLQACHDFAEAVVSKRLAHDDPFLDSEMNIAQRRYIGKDGSWRWVITPNAITSVVASTLAVAYANKAIAPVQLFL
jgi:hypothetical protein